MAGLDNDPGKIETQLRAGRRIAFGDAGDPELWEDLNLERLQAVILTVPDVETKVRATRLLREKGYVGAISATRMDGGEYAALAEAGATSVCHPLTEAGVRLAELSVRAQEGTAARARVLPAPDAPAAAPSD